MDANTRNKAIHRKQKDVNNIWEASYSSNEIHKMGDRNINSSRNDSSCDRQVSKQLRCLQNFGVNNSRDTKKTAGMAARARTYSRSRH